MSSQVFMFGRWQAGLRRGPHAAALAIIAGAVLLAGCASRLTPAPVADLSEGAASPASGSVTTTGAAYTVQAGDTLYSIARAHNMPVETLASINNITDPTQLAVGQTLQVSGTAVVVAPSTPATSPAEVAPVATTEPVLVPGTEAIEKPKVPARAADANLVSWGWPAAGEVLQGFSPATKGIDIAGATGSPVVAAADGEVMYVGNGVRGLGNLVLIGHGNNFITAYGHNETLLAKTGTRVKKGDKIATLGQTDTTSPRLHFEIRRDGTPVNPLSYLPAR